MADKKISFILDVNGKPIDVAIDKTLNLQKQVKLLTAELRKTNEGTTEFKLLSTKLGDTQDQLARTTAKSRDLFSSLSMLPGPIGQFSAQLQGGIELLKTFSSFTGKDIGFQLKETFGDIADIFKNIFGPAKDGMDNLSNGTENLKNKSDDLNNSLTLTTQNVAENSVEILNTSKNYEKLSNKIERQKTSQAEINLEIAKYEVLLAEVEQIEASLGKSKLTLEQATANLTNAQKQLTTAENNMAMASRGAAVGVETLAAAEETATVATSVLGKTIKTVLISTGILIAIVVIGELIALLYQWTQGTKAADEENEKFNRTLKEQNNLLEVEKDLIGQSMKLMEARMKAQGKSEEEIAKARLEFSRQTLNELLKNDEFLVKKREEISKNTVLKEEQKTKLLNQVNEEYLKNGREIDKLLIQMEIDKYNLKIGLGNKLKEKEKKDADDRYNSRLKELDALIQLEINKDQTRQKQLQDYLDERLRLEIEHAKKMKMSQAEIDLIRQNNSKRVAQALMEDTDRVNNFIQKSEEIRIAALKDEQQREEEARSNKLYFDKIALSKEYEFQKKSKEEQNQILKNLEETFQMDMIKIREKYLIKKVQKEQDAAIKEQNSRTFQKEVLLQIVQLQLLQEGDFQLTHQKKLEKYYDDRFVNLRQAYDNEFIEVGMQLEKSKEQLNEGLLNKQITEEEYANQVALINDKIGENNRKLVERNIQLQQIEIQAKQAQTDALVNIGNNLVGLLSAIAGKSKKIQVAAALTEAAVAIARVIIDTQRAIISFAAAVSGLGPVGAAMAASYALKMKIGAALAIGTIVGQGIARLNQIKSENEEGGGGERVTNNLGRNYEKGGLIGGKRHAEGGTIIEAEKGEAIMTRGAVTMFQPLLSMMNQLGGGTPFNNGIMGGASPDNPALNNPNTNNFTPIIKTYVVSSEMTSEMEKQARLKDLSTL